MVDITKVQLNAIPAPIVVLQSANTTLQSKNQVLSTILIIGGIILGCIIVDRIISSFEEENQPKTIS